MRLRQNIALDGTAPGPTACPIRGIAGHLLDSPDDRGVSIFTPTRCPTTVDVAVIGAASGDCLQGPGFAELGVQSIRLIDRPRSRGHWYWTATGIGATSMSYVLHPAAEELGFVPPRNTPRAMRSFAHCRRIAEYYGFIAISASDRGQRDSLDPVVRAGSFRPTGDAIRARFVAMANGTYRSRTPGMRFTAIPRACVHTSRVDYDYKTGSGLPCCQTSGGHHRNRRNRYSACPTWRIRRALAVFQPLRRPSMCVATDRRSGLVGSPRRWLAAPPYREFSAAEHRR